MKGEYYHLSRDFSGHTLSGPVFPVEYESGCISTILGGFSEIQGVQAKISYASNKSTRIGINVAIQGSIGDKFTINNKYI